MKLKAKLLVAAVLLAFILGTPVLIYQICRSGSTPEKPYERTWKISIPDHFTEKAHYSSEHGFQGDGWRYTVFQSDIKNAAFSMRPACPPQEIAYSTDNSDEGRNEGAEAFLREAAENSDAPDEALPAFDEQYVWKELTKDDNDRLVVLYFPSSGLAFFAEELI
jgi:hypothetical protein